ncbi:MAG: phosphoribosylamine--glycine ligase [Azorhizobium sp. 32-67-21]|nr:MAG: phosphoribosylamine--glycine ligase [Azorhizobium sp. 32-67-21]
MNVLLLGSGGREHALAWKLAKSPLIGQFYAMPGNPGIADVAEAVEGVPLSAHQTIVSWCQAHAIELVVVGPEAPLVAGLVDRLKEAGIPAFGPTAAAARLEGSKLFTKELCRENGIPTAAFARFSSAPEAAAYVRSTGAPIVVKADGLMAGKGVVVALNIEEAISAVEGVFAAGGQEVLIEEFMEGEEASLFCLVDGETVIPFGSAQDHKRAFDGDLGPNTGGMGAYSPAPVLPILAAAATGRLAETEVKWSDRSALTVVYASRGYPGAHQTGTEICGLEAANEVEGVTVFLAGTKKSGSKLLANGGRVLNVTATGETLQEARDRAYDAAARIKWSGGFYRQDIGWRALK